MNTNGINERFRQLAFHAATSALERVQQYKEFPDQNQFHDRIHSVRETFVGIIPLLQRVVFYFVLGSFLLTTSVLFYGFFYLIVMPSHAATEQLYFDYTCSEINTLDVCNVTSMDQCQTSCSPTATVDIFARHSNWDAYIENIQPAPKSEKRILKVRQHYFLELKLQLPESNINKELGMFGVTIELQTKDRKAVAKSVRSARIPHESDWIGNVRKFTLLAPLIVGALTESRTVIVPAFRHFVEHKDFPLQHIVVTLESQGSSWRSDVPVEVIGGQLSIGKELIFFQTILKEWFWTCLTIGTTFIFVSQWIIFFLAKIILESMKDAELQQRQEEDLAEQPYSSNTEQFDSAEDPARNMDDEWTPMSENSSLELERTKQSENNDNTPTLTEELQ